MGGQSGYLYTLTRRPDGLTDVDEVVVRDGKTVKGRLIGFAIGTVGKRTFANGLASTVKAIEDRTYAPHAA